MVALSESLRGSAVGESNKMILRVFLRLAGCIVLVGASVTTVAAATPRIQGPGRCNRRSGQRPHGAHDAGRKGCPDAQYLGSQVRRVRHACRVRPGEDGAPVSRRHRAVCPPVGCHRTEVAARGPRPRRARHGAPGQCVAALRPGTYPPGHSYLVPRGRPAWLCGAGSDQFPASHRACLELRPGAAARGQQRHRPRDSRARCQRGADPRSGRGPRTALGPHRGDLRRRSVPGGRTGRGRHPRPAGR